ncbi:MAG: ABC transporter substrate-binding protein [Ktedonobacteraceae bacterium]|nr:ABC transporter substrate-binding protein [Ktedonobacteraceae bacterium]
MSQRHRSSMLLSFVSPLVLLALLLTACGSTTTTTGSGTPAATTTNLTIGLGYIPDVQFAPFYVAKSKGYYSAAGLNVTFNHGIVPDLFGSMVAGRNTFVFAGGDELLTARDKNIPAIDVSTIFQKYPVSLIVPSDSSIKTLADLKGHTIGIPGAYGSTYTGLLALLYSAHLKTTDVKLQTIGFTQVPALISHKVDAVMGYSNNEALQLPQRGFPVRTFNVSDYQPLISNGIITTENTYHNQSAMVKSFVDATLKGLKDVVADPSAALTICKTYIPTLTDTTQALTVLKATIPIWQGKGQAGYNDSATWQSMEQFLVAQKMIAPVKDLTQDYVNLASS